MLVDIELLKRLDACAEHRDAFAAAFPDGLTVTGEPDADTIARAVDAKLNVWWLCNKVLTAPSLAAYLEATAPALAEYERVRDAALAEYERVRDAAAWRFLSDPDNIRPPSTEKEE